MDRKMFNYKEINSSMIEEIKELYKKNSWSAYLKDDEKLKRTLDNSLYIEGAFDENKLIGMIRCVGDGEHVLMVQDLLVDPEYQQQGVGTYLLKSILQKYAKARMFVVLTGTEDLVDDKFYKSFNLKTLEDKNIIGYMR